jgi:acetyl-CoA carboxylase biotin carboxyl carrier protein
MTWPANPAEQVTLLQSWLTGTRITLLELTTQDGTIRLTREPGAATPHRQPVGADSGTVVTAHATGVFRHGHPLRSGALVQPGDAVQPGSAIGLLQVGALLLIVTAPVGGTVLQHLTEDGATIGYGAPLLRMQRSDTP